MAWEHVEFTDILFDHFNFPSVVNGTNFVLCTFNISVFRHPVQNTTFEGCIGVVRFDQGAEQIILSDFNGNLFSVFPRIDPGVWLDVATGLFVEE